jgi:hypothetical protein
MLPKTTQKSQRANSYLGRTNSLAKSDVSSVYSEQIDTSVFKAKQNDDNYCDVTFQEIMEYYTPTWLAVAGFCASVVASLNLPLFGFVLS